MKAETQRLGAILMQHQQMMEQRERLHREQVRQMEINRVYQQALQQRAQERRLKVLISIISFLDFNHIPLSVLMRT